MANIVLSTSSLVDAGDMERRSLSCPVDLECGSEILDLSKLPP